VLVGATTEIPRSRSTPALLSAGARPGVFHSLDPDAIEKLFVHAEKIEGQKRLPSTMNARPVLVTDGRRRRPRRADARGRSLARRARGRDFQCASIADILQRPAPIYDKSADGHYNLNLGAA